MKNKTRNDLPRRSSHNPPEGMCALWTLSEDGTQSFAGFVSENSKPARKQKILGILRRGNIAVFTMGDIVKKVNKWNPDTHDDLEAFHSTGKTRFLCWWNESYEITEEFKK